jgi:hypothetical protein
VPVSVMVVSAVLQFHAGGFNSKCAPDLLAGLHAHVDKESAETLEAHVLATYSKNRADHGHDEDYQDGYDKHIVEHGEILPSDMAFVLGCTGAYGS